MIYRTRRDEDCLAFSCPGQLCADWPNELSAEPAFAKANVDQVERGMAKKQVESILGPPTTVETKDLLGLKKTIYLYTQGKDSVTVTFRDDKVESKESTLND